MADSPYRSYQECAALALPSGSLKEQPNLHIEENLLFPEPALFEVWKLLLQRSGVLEE